MKHKKEFVSKRLAEVWAWKNAINQEVKDLPTDEAIKKILRNARAAAKKYKIRHRSASSACVAHEHHRKYGK